ncbi:MAG: hypothetical protein GF387_00780 [Candidatus Portnoybacteria bacterium]|nr:hypothetical protein [Candidatus Portnoybacteria bacterium]
MKEKIVFMVFLVAMLFSITYAFRVSPVRFNLTIPRGETQEFVLNFTTSKGIETESLLLYPTDISMKRNGALVFERKEGFKHSAVPWIDIAKSEINLLGSQTKEVNFSISVPLRAEPGEYYAVIMCEPTRSTAMKAEQRPFMVNMKQRVAVVIVLDVPGRIYKKEGEAISAEVKESNNKLKIISTFQNKGNIHLDVLGTVYVRSKDGKTMYAQVVMQPMGGGKKEAFIFPGNARDFVGTIERPLPPGEYVVDVAYDYGYKFRKARLQSAFSITREVEENEDKAEFLVINLEEISIEKEAQLRTKVIKATNTDYKPLHVLIDSDEWIEVSPSTLILQPGRSRNIKVIISNPNQETKKGQITLKPDTGKEAKISVRVGKNQKGGNK